MPRYKVTLTEEERKELTKNYTRGKHSAHTVLSARAWFCWTPVTAVRRKATRRCPKPPG